MFGPLGTQHKYRKMKQRTSSHVGLDPFQAERVLCLLIRNSFLFLLIAFILLIVHAYVLSSVLVKALNEVVLQPQFLSGQLLLTKQRVKRSAMGTNYDLLVFIFFHLCFYETYNIYLGKRKCFINCSGQINATYNKMNIKDFSGRIVQ